MGAPHLNNILYVNDFSMHGRHILKSLKMTWCSYSEWMTGSWTDVEMSVCVCVCV